MTLKELLDEQEKKFGEEFCVMLERSLYTDEEIEGVYTFLRQNTIDTVKWVIKLSTELEKTKWETGKPKGLIDLIFELKKSIEDHA